MGAVQGKRGALEAVTLPFQLVPPVNDLAEMATMARLWPSSAAWLFFVMVMMVGSGPPFAQRHDRSGLAWLREEVSQLFSEGNYTEAIPVAERYFAIARQRYGQSHPEFRAAVGWLAAIYYAQAVRCLGAEARPGELTLGSHSF
jgi:hypothetical protein